MLRWVIVLLLLANTGYFLWAQGHLAPLGLVPTLEREPERLQGQIRPEVQRLLNAPRDAVLPAETVVPAPAEPASAAPEVPPTETPPAESAAVEAALGPEATSAPAAPVTAAAEPARACWQAGTFTEAQVDRLRTALPDLGLPASGWQLVESRSNGRWIVYMGRYDNEEQLERKRAELRELKVDFRTVSAPGLAPGLALGTFSSEAAAQQGLEKVMRDGVRTARLVQERAESLNFTLRLPAATPVQRAAVASMGPPLAGKTLQACD